MSALRVDRLRLSIAGRELVERLSVSLATGEWLALTAPSGAGKTLTLRAIAGLLDPDEGELSLDGRRPAELGWPIWRRRVLYVAQRPVMLEGSVGENLERAFHYRAAEGPYPAEQARELLAELGIDGQLEQRARTLSVGEQQRVALVRALLLRPDVLLLDEPTSALDPDATRKAEQLLRGAGRSAAILVTHDAMQAARLCDRSLPLCSTTEEPRG